MFFGMMMYSFGWIGCVLPANGMGGGAAGLSLVLCTALENLGLHMQIGTMVFLINAVLLIVGGFIVGWNFGIKTIFCVVVISVGMNFWQDVLPEGNFLGIDSLLSIVMGGILAGAGIALCFTQGGSTGGTDIVAMIINKYRTISYGKILIYSDFVIIASSLLVGKGISAVIYGYVLTAVVDLRLRADGRGGLHGGYDHGREPAVEPGADRDARLREDGGRHCAEHPPGRDAHRFAGMVLEGADEDGDGGVPEA